ncbi:MAG: methyltransferase domain-containing protein [Dehalococcoidia bacterium]
MRGEACVVCGAVGRVAVRGAKLAHLWDCAECGLRSVRELASQDELRAVYGESYFQSERSHVVGYSDYAADRSCILATASRRLRSIERLLPEKGRLLDVGCALGYFARAALDRGWTAEGLDISAHAVEHARSVEGIEARCGSIEEAGYAPGSFDVLTLWDVIEHVPDPAAYLRACSGLLRPGGVLALSTPDRRSLVAKATGSRWMGYKLADEHLYYFDRRTMADALRTAGLRPLRAGTAGKHVTAGFFADRLQLYAGPAGRLLGGVVRRLGLAERAVYVDPRDILFLAARKPVTH